MMYCAKKRISTYKGASEYDLSQISYCQANKAMSRATYKISTPVDNGILIP